MLTEIVTYVGAVASIATAIGVIIAGHQLRLSQRVATTQFEDQLNGQYRELIRRLPVQALLGEPLAPEELQAHPRRVLPLLRSFERAGFFHEKGRIRDETWIEWKTGIRQHLRRPAFHDAWSEIARRTPDNFDELRRIVPPG